MNKKVLKYLLSAIILLEGILFLITSAVGLIYLESQAIIYAICGVACVVVGYLGARKKYDNSLFFAKEGFFAVALGWLILSFIGALPIFLTGEIPNYIDALFEISSGFTTTGSSILSDIESLSHTSLFWRSFTHFFGGMGVLVLVLTILPNVSSSGMYIMKAESPGPVVGKFVSKLSDTAKILYLIYSGLTAIEFVVLLILGMPVFDSINIAFETAGTGGFAIYNAGLANLSTPVLMTVAIFMVLFGINFNVYYFILIKKAKEAFKCEEMHIYLFIIIVATILVGINISGLYSSLAEAFKMSFFHVSSLITTTGFSAVDFDAWPSFSKTILILMMFFGACAGSTGGGFKISRIAIIVKDAIASLKKLVHPREVHAVYFEGKAVDKETIDSVKSYLGLYCMIFIISIILISFDNFDFGTNFTAVLATLNNIGPGINAIGPTCNFSAFSAFSKIVLIFDMITGRLEIVPMIMIFMPFVYSNRR